MECNAIGREKRLGHVRSDRSDINLQRPIESIESGNTTYVPEKACKRGHYLRFSGSNNCVECNRLAMEKRKASGYSKDRYFKTTYNLSKEEYGQLVYDAYSCCELCKRMDLALHVDHCHATGKIRGILCSSCNQALGLAKDDPELLRKMANYLEERVDGIPAP